MEIAERELIMNKLDTYILYGVLLLMIVFIPFVIINISQGDKSKIQKTLEKKGAKNITISSIPLDLDDNNRSYEVTYEDSAGKKHQRRCKLNLWSSSIYWEDEAEES
jgi:hypothetical protein